VCGQIREPIEVYVEALEENGQPVPASQAYELIEVQGV
jgi:predicted RNase H-like HicB family nuclease